MRLSQNKPPVHTSESQQSLRFVEVDIPFKLILLDSGIEGGDSPIEPRSRRKMKKAFGFGLEFLDGEKPARNTHRLISGDDDQLEFHEIHNGCIKTDRIDGERSQSSQVVLEAAKIIDEFSSLKNQIADLKAHLINMRGDTQLRSNKYPNRTSVNKHKICSVLRETSGSKPAKTTDKKKNKSSLKTILSSNTKQGFSVPRSMSSKRLSSQKNGLRASLFHGSRLEGSLEKYPRPNSFEKYITHNRDTAHRLHLARANNIMGLALPKQSPKKQLHTDASVTGGVGLGTSDSNTIYGRGHSESRGVFLDQLLEAFPKTSAAQKKRNVDVISLININNLYSGIKPHRDQKQESLKRRIRNKFTTSSNSHEKGIGSVIHNIPSQSHIKNLQPRGSCDEFRVSYTTIRLRSKHSNKAHEGHNFTSENTRHELTELQRRKEEMRSRKTDRSANPAILSLKRWNTGKSTESHKTDKPSQRFGLGLEVKLATVGCAY